MVNLASSDASVVDITAIEQHRVVVVRKVMIITAVIEMQMTVILLNVQYVVMGLGPIAVL